MLNFEILIVSAVKICKQCLQTASASGAWTPLGYDPQMKIRGAAIGYKVSYPGYQG